jgi:hypothetical protein
MLSKFNVLFLIALLSGCVSYVEMPDGQYSTMSSDLNSVRKNISIRTVVIDKLEYTAGPKCSYKTYNRKYGEVITTEKYHTAWLTKIPEGEDYKGTIIQKSGIEANTIEGTTTFQINKNGKLIYFNLHEDFSEGIGRVDNENYIDTIDRVMTGLKQDGKYVEGSTVYINPIDFLMPEFKDLRLYKSGTVVSEVKTSTGNLFAEYVFRGKSTYDGRSVFVLDLKRAYPSYPSKSFLLGYSFIDANTLFPVYLAVEAGTKKSVSILRSCE